MSWVNVRFRTPRHHARECLTYDISRTRGPGTETNPWRGKSVLRQLSVLGGRSGVRVAVKSQSAGGRSGVCVAVKSQSVGGRSGVCVAVKSQSAGGRSGVCVAVKSQSVGGRSGVCVAVKSQSAGGRSSVRVAVKSQSAGLSTYVERRAFLLAKDRLVGLVVRRPPRERKVPGSNPACAGIFSRSSHTSDLNIGTPVATLPGAWRYRVSAGTRRPGVSIL